MEAGGKRSGTEPGREWVESRLAGFRSLCDRAAEYRVDFTAYSVLVVYGAEFFRKIIK